MGNIYPSSQLNFHLNPKSYRLIIIDTSFKLNILYKKFSVLSKFLKKIRSKYMIKNYTKNRTAAFYIFLQHFGYISPGVLRYHTSTYLCMMNN